MSRSGLLRFIGLLGILGLVTPRPGGAWAADSAQPEPSAHPTACVLNFERRLHPLSSMLTEKLSDMDGVRLINEARPVDILKCLDDGVVSVMIIGHAADLESKNQVTAPLVYFRELRGREREDFLDQLQKQLDEKMDEFYAKTRSNSLKGHEGWDYYRIFELLQKLKKIPADLPVYDQPRLVENQIWRRVLSSPGNLRKISIVSCLQDEVAAYYPELQVLRDRGIEIEFGPVNRVMSFLMGKNVASPDFDWMKRTLDDALSKNGRSSGPTD